MCLKVKRSVILKPLSLIMTGILVLSVIAGAVFSAPVLVFAWSVGGLQSTIASLIISLMLQAGVAPVNQTWLNQINASYGIESSIGTIGDCIENGLLTETGGQLIDTGLSEAIANQTAYSLIDDIFTTTAVDEGVAIATGATNLANTAIHVGTLGTIGAFAGAATIGVGIGILANHIINKVKDYVKARTPITTPQEVLNEMASGEYNISMTETVNNTRYYFYYGDSVLMTFSQFTTSSGATTFPIYSVNMSYNNTNNVRRVQYDINNNILSNEVYTMQPYMESAPSNLRGNNIRSLGQVHNGNYENMIFLGSDDYASTTIGALRETNKVPPTYSPDLIGDNGNLTYDPENDTIPDVNRQVPDGYDMRPVNMTDYQDYVDQANDNTQNGDVDEETQGQDLTDFIQPYLQPEQNQDQPSLPDEPVGPDQPDFPIKPTPIPEEIDDVLNMTAESNIKDKFPFCIPFDVVDMLRAFTANRTAPSITCPVDLNGNTITVDLQEFEGVASLVRLLELILFIIGLALATRKLIGAGG